MFAALIGALARGAGAGASRAAASAQAQAAAMAKSAQASRATAQASKGKAGPKPPPLPWEKQEAAAKKAQEAADKASKAADHQSHQFDRMVSHMYMAQGMAQNLGSTISGGLTKALTSGAAAVQGMAAPIESLVALANPAAVEAFARASNDAFAVIGRVLTPIMNALTRAMQAVGDHYAKIEPILAPVAARLAKAIDRVMTAMSKVAGNGVPAIELMADALLVAIDAAEMMAHAVLFAVDAFQRFFGIVGLARKLGYDGSRAKNGASSAGAAVRNVSTTTNAEDLSRKAIEKALMQAMNPGQKTEADVPNILTGIGGSIAEILQELKKMADNIPTRKDLVELITKLPGMLAKEALAATPIGAIASVAGGGGVGSAIASGSGGGAAERLIGLIRSTMTR